MVPLFYVNCGAHNFQDGFDIQIPNGSLIFLKTDLNKDSVVDAADLKIFTETFSSNDPRGDFNLDGIVDAIDLELLKQDYCKFENLDINGDGVIDGYDLEVVQNSLNDNYNTCYDVNKDGIVNNIDIEFYFDIGINNI